MARKLSERQQKILKYIEVQVVSLFERIIQLNAWLERYHVELVL